MADGCKDNDGKGPCSTICLPLPYGKYKCACGLGADLNPIDQRTCSDGKKISSSCCKFAYQNCNNFIQDLPDKHL